MPSVSQSLQSDFLPIVRYLWRVPLLCWHLLVHLPLTLLLINPLSAQLRVRGERIDYWAIRAWSAGLLRIFGIRSRRFGTPHPGPCLSVANHQSWIDIEVAHSQRVLHFIAKSEISSWPLVGWLARRAGTIYHQRGSSESLNSVAQIAVQRLRQGEAVGVFPEGGTAPDPLVRNFHARIFQIAVDADVPVQPVALRFTRHGTDALDVPFREGESFMANFFRLLGAAPLHAEVHFLPICADLSVGRRRLAELARWQIRNAMQQVSVDD